jgi:Flp pilus assembly protein TadD
MRVLLSSCAMLVALTACGVMPSTSKHNDPMGELEKIPGPAIDGIAATQQKAAEQALAQGDLRRAAQFYQQLLGSSKLTDAQKRAYQLKLVEVQRRAGDFEGAQKNLTGILAVAPNDPEALENKGLVLLAQGKPQEAGVTFERVMQIDEKRWRTLNGLGILFMTKSMVPEAMAYFTEAIKYSSDNPSVLNNVGLAFAVDRKFPKAIEALDQASRYAGTDSLKRRQIDLNTALVLGISGDLDGARKLAVRHLKGPALDNNLGLYAYLANNQELAKAYLNTALTNSEFHYERAWENLEAISAQSVEKTVQPGEKSIRIP